MGPEVVLLILTAVTPGVGRSQTVTSQTPPSPSAPKPESNPFYDQLRQPWQLYRAGKLDQAAAGFRAVLEKATAVQDHLAQAWAQDALGTICFDKAEYPAARDAYERALRFYQSVPDDAGEAIANQQLGNVNELMGNHPLAREYYRKALKTFERLGLLHYQASILGALAHAKDPDGEKLEQRALEIAREIGDRDLQARFLHGIGDMLFNRGVYDAAEEHYDEAAALYQQTDNRAGLARVLTSQGRLQRAHGHSEKSLELYGRALQLQQDSHDRQGAIQSINAMAVAWQQLGDNAKAAANYQRALSMARETGSQNIIAFELANLAGAYISIGRELDTVEILEKLLHENPAMEWADLRHETLSIAYFHLGRFPQSIEAARKAVELMRAGRRLSMLPDALFWKARAEEKAGYHEAALTDAEACLRGIEELRAHLVPSDFMKRGFAEQTYRAFSFTIKLLTAARQPDRALEVAEEARSRAFLDLLATRSFQIQEEQSAPAREMADQPFTEGPDDGAQSGAEPDTSAIWRQWTSVDTELRSVVAAQPVSFAGVQAAARRLDSTVLSYWVSEDATFVWVVSPAGEVHSASTAVSSDRLRKLIGALWSGGAAAGAPDAGSRDHWNELYRLLIQPVEKWLPVRPGRLLTIEPHGPLLRLPFAALRDAQGRYLIERFTLHYVPAISLLDFNREKELGARGQRFLLVADPAGIPNGPDGKPLAALPGARREVAAVARMLHASEATLLAGKQATEERVKELAGQSTVIHVATHGIIRDDHPFDSFLALSSSGPGKDRDGRFTAQKIYGLHLKSDLVFLSACRSGLGQVTGDGIMGLTRAFLYAGTSSVIASLWDVADEPTYRLVSAFYRSWLQGKDKSAALRSAQIGLLRALRAGQVTVHAPGGDVALPEDPVLWASFVLEGAP